jgi:hypothetical protein
MESLGTGLLSCAASAAFNAATTAVTTMAVLI